MALKILVLNIGSSSCKAALFADSGRASLWMAHLDWKENMHEAHLKVFLQGHEPRANHLQITSLQEGIQKVLETFPNHQIDAIGHRVVHGGREFHAPTLITDAVKKKLQAVSELAPLHNRSNCIGIEVAQTFFPDKPHYAVFDTAFHATLPAENYTYGIPFEWSEKGIRRFGFHGINHQYCMHAAASFLKKETASLKMVVCHLGSGASLCAIKEGKSYNTTMGMTPLEGLVMATRSGTIDPGIIFHLIEKEKIPPALLESILNEKSGLFGISGISGDIRDLLEAKHDARAILALSIFTKRIQELLGSMIATLAGIDVVVFTAGIGENISCVRESVCASFKFIGMEIDQEKNRSPSKEQREISSKNSKIRILVIPAQEEWQIAKLCREQL